MSWTDVVGVKGWCRCQGGARCEVVCLLRGVVRGVSSVCPAGCVASMEGCLQGMSSWDESLSGSGRESCEGCVSSGSSRLKRPSVCVRSCRSMACWKTRPKVHVAGVPLSSVATDCRLRHSIVGCDDVVVGAGDGKAQLVLFPVCERTSLSPWCTVPRLQRGSEVPLLLL